MLRDRYALESAVFVFTYLAICVSTLRWLRVAQREHYLAGSVAEFALRWWTVHWGNVVLLLAFLVLAGLSYVHPFWGAGAATCLTFMPAGLSLRGRTSRLAWTPRMIRLAVVVGALFLVAAMAGYLGGRVGYTIFVLSGLVAPAIVDLALAMTGPLERMLSEKYVREARRKLESIKPLVVGITGSYGKTTTKHYAAHLMGGSRRVFATPGSYNNRLGIARAINDSMPPSTEVFVAEVGTYARGEIADICRWLRPHVAALLAVGPVHLERFGSLDEIAAAKAEILEGAATVVANMDDERVSAKVRERESAFDRVIWYSCVEPSAEVYVSVAGDTGTLHIRGDRVSDFDSNLHIPYNVAAAAALALGVGCPPAEIGGRISTLPAVDHRRTVDSTPRGAMVIDDTYNSNPVGARKALDLLESLRSEGGRAVVVTPGMVELGDIQYEENLSLAKEVCGRGFELAVVGYTNRKALLEGARSSNGRVSVFDTREEAVAWVRENLGEGDVVLFENDLPDHYP